MSSQQIKDLRQIVVGFVVTAETYLQKYFGTRRLRPPAGC
jgi:hypothetical protein